MRSKITPSRSAHGQISNSGSSKISMQASATNAPATSWADRPCDTPGSAARSAEVIAAIEGPIGVTECGIEEEHPDCDLSARCDVRGNWQLINAAILSALEGITLEQMARPPEPVLVALGRKPAPLKEATS